MASRISRWGAPVTYVAAVLIIGMTLIGILVRSPDTKANFQDEPGAYDRTELAVIGTEDQFLGLQSELMEALEGLYVGAGCAGCHGLTGEGNAVGPEIRGHDLDEMRTALREGAFGMPAFSESRLSERQIGALTTYLARFGSPSDRESGSGTSEDAPND